MTSKEYLEQFLNDKQKESINDYQYIPTSQISTLQIKKGDYIKFMYVYNYQFMEGGIVMDINNYPTIRLKSYSTPPILYNIDLTKVFVFYKRNKKRQTKREFFEQLLLNLKKK